MTQKIEKSLNITIHLDPYLQNMIDAISPGILDQSDSLDQFIRSAIIFKLSKGSRYSGRNINQLDASGKVIAQYNSIRQASLMTGESYWGIRDCIRGVQKHTSGGYGWKPAAEVIE